LAILPHVPTQQESAMLNRFFPSFAAGVAALLLVGCAVVHPVYQPGFRPVVAGYPLDQKAVDGLMEWAKGCGGDTSHTRDASVTNRNGWQDWQTREQARCRSEQRGGQR
jgi:hypothetical protein